MGPTAVGKSALALEVAKKNVTVNTISPGYIETEMVASVPENIRNSIIAQIPVGRFGTPEDVAKVKASWTGRYLAEALDKARRQGAGRGHGDLLAQHGAHGQLEAVQAARQAQPGLQRRQAREMLVDGVGRGVQHQPAFRLAARKTGGARGVIIRVDLNRQPF